MEIPKLLTNWQNAIKDKDVKIILDNYAKEAVLLGIYANNIKIGHYQIKTYFDELIKKEELNVVFNEIFAQKITNGEVYNGVYTFMWKDKYLNLHKSAKARFTFVYKKIKGKGKILTHHSSVQYNW